MGFHITACPVPLDLWNTSNIQSLTVLYFKQNWKTGFVTVAVFAYACVRLLESPPTIHGINNSRKYAL